MIEDPAHNIRASKGAYAPTLEGLAVVGLSAFHFGTVVFCFSGILLCCTVQTNTRKGVERMLNRPFRPRFSKPLNLG